MTIETTLFILRGLSALLGGAFFVITLRAYLKTRAASMGTLALATALLTIGTVTEGLIITIFPGNLDLAHILESVVFLVAFSVLLLSIVTHRTRHPLQDPDSST